MRKAAILLLLLLSVFAGSFLQAKDFSFEYDEKIVVEEEGVEVPFTVSIAKGKAFNIVVKVGSPAGLASTLDKVYFPAIIEGEEDAIVLSGNAGTYTAKGLFVVESWDNTVFLNVEPVDIRKNKTVTVRGVTDDAEFCTEYGNEGAFSKKENCNTMIAVNGQQMGFAQDDGTFEFDVGAAIGVSELVVEATDPGGNTAEKELIVVREAKSVVDAIKENSVLAAAGAIIFVAVLVLLTRLPPPKGLGAKQEELIKEMAQGRPVRPELRKLVERIAYSDKVIDGLVKDKASFGAKSRENKEFVLGDSYQAFAAGHFKILMDKDVGPDVKSTVAQEYDRVIKNRIKALIEKQKRSWVKAELEAMVGARKTYAEIKETLVGKGLTPEEADTVIRKFVNGEL